MAIDTLAALHASLGLIAPDAGEIEIVGADPVLPTQFRVGDAAAAALGAVGLAAARIHEARKGARQRVRVATDGAAASLLSFLYQKVESGGAMEAWDARGNLTDFYAAKSGGWFLFHQSFPDTQAKALALLGCAATREALVAKIADWDAQALEDAFAEHGLCGARVRTAAEWAAHSQARALAAVPVVEVIRRGDSPPEPLAPGARPLEGVRALDLTRVLAGPTCGRTLAAHGADVLRIGSPKLPFVAPFVMDTSHGKRSAHLHLRDPGDAARLRELARHADVFTQGYRSGALERLGFGPEALFALRPGLIYVSINCYGHDGPWATRPGWEQLAQTVTGIAAEQGGAPGPKLLPAAATDYNTGYLAALGVMLALERRAREGGSYEVRASLARTGMWLDSLGRADRPGPGLTPERVAPFMTRSETPYGRLAHLGPIVEMTGTPARWARPTCPLGSHPPEW